MSTRANGRSVTPAPSFQFDVYTLPGGPLPRGEVGFSEATGLRAEVEAVEYKEGNDLYTDQLPGRSLPAKVTLRRGMDKSNHLVKWFAMIQERTALPLDEARHDVYVVVWNRQGAPGAAEVPAEKLRVLKISKAWPTALETTDLSATSSEINVITLELVGKGPIEVLYPAIDQA